MHLRVLLVFFALSFQVLAQKHQKFLDAGIKLMNEEKYEEALVQLKSAVSAGSKVAETYYQRGRCYLNLGRNKEAKEDFWKAIELEPKAVIYYDLYGAACENLSDTITAINYYSKAITADSTNARGYISLARILYASKKTKEALGITETGIKKSVNQISLYLIKGDVLQELKDTAAAINAYRSALVKDSLVYGANYALALIYSDKNKNKEALSYINKAINGDVKNPEGYVERGLILENLKDTVEALKNYNKAIDLDKNYTFAYFNRGMYYQLHGNSTAAIADFTKMISLDPNDADAYISRAECYSDTDNCASALLDLEVARKLTPNDPDVYFKIGTCQDETRYYREALESFTKAISIDSTASEYFYSRGNSYYNLELLDMAEKDYFKALKLDSTSAGPYFNLGNIHFDKKEFDVAIKYYDIYLKKEVKDADALVNRGICKNGLGLEKDACEDWKAAAALNSFEAKENLKKFCKQ